MARILLIICAVVLCALAPPETALAQLAADPGEPPAQLIKPRSDQTHAAPAHAHLGPVDERCKPLKDQLEAALQKAPKDRRTFQARLAHNAGTRFCREGKPDRGLAELQRGLSYLQAEAKP
jgi:hypothetical protein